MGVLKVIAADGQKRQGHSQHAQLRPYPLADARVSSGHGRCRDRHRRRLAGSAGDDRGHGAPVGGRNPVVICVKGASDESGLMFWIRKRYYRMVNRLSGIETYENFTGFGLYDRRVVESVKSFDDPYPYFRGIIAELGFPRVELPYHQPLRKRGITKNNFYSLYDIAMLGITNLSKVPLRLAVFAGFAGALLSVLVSLGISGLQVAFLEKLRGWCRANPHRLFLSRIAVSYCSWG